MGIDVMSTLVDLPKPLHIPAEDSSSFLRSRWVSPIHACSGAPGAGWAVGLQTTAWCRGIRADDGLLRAVGT